LALFWKVKLSVDESNWEVVSGWFFSIWWRRVPDLLPLMLFVFNGSSLSFGLMLECSVLKLSWCYYWFEFTLLFLIWLVGSWVEEMLLASVGVVRLVMSPLTVFEISLLAIDDASLPLLAVPCFMACFLNI
jgi:hypothetical protein